jgi:hypothetical protein
LIGKETINNFSYRFYGFMSPKPQYGPPCGLQSLRLFAVPSGIAFELRRPVLAVDSRAPTVFRTAVPETSINEDGNLPLREYNVGSNESSVNPDRKILTESVTEAV